MAELIELKRLVSDGTHNAFTDLLQWRGHTYLAFRKARKHGIEPPGEIVLWRSADLRTWEPCAEISTGGDDRDPKLIDAGDRLGIIFGTWYPRWSDGSVPNTPFDLISQVCVSSDGLEWSTPRQVWGVNYWLWRVFASAGEGFFCSAYHFPWREKRTDRSIHLLHSTDLFDWHLVGMMREGDGPGEPVLYQPKPGLLHCVIRRESDDHRSWFGCSESPYTEWTWHDMGVMIHAPVVLAVDDAWIVAGRSRPGDLPPGTVPKNSGAHTTLWRIGLNGAAEHLLTVPSGGDCSYCGLVRLDNGDVLMSYYSQHEWLPQEDKGPVPADIFLARIRL